MINYGDIPVSLADSIEPHILFVLKIWLEVFFRSPMVYSLEIYCKYQLEN